MITFIVYESKSQKKFCSYFIPKSKYNDMIIVYYNDIYYQYCCCYFCSAISCFGVKKSACFCFFVPEMFP